MTGHPKKPSRRYYHARVYPSGEHTAEIVLGFYGEDDPHGGELAIRWYDFLDPPVPRLEASTDAWPALAHTELLTALATLAPATHPPLEVAAALEAIGFIEVDP